MKPQSGLTESAVSFFHFPSSTCPPIRQASPRHRAAFSLTEVVIALGVATVAFTSIIALFPLGLNMSKESHEQTQAALIAQTILGDLRDIQGGNPQWNTTLVDLGFATTNDWPSGFRLLQIKPGGETNEFSSANYTNIQVRQSLIGDKLQTVYLRYDLISTNSVLPLRPNGTITPTQYSNGITTGTNPAALVLVEINPMLNTNDIPSSGPYLHSVRVSVETPGNFPATRRTAFVFGGLIR